MDDLVPISTKLDTVIEDTTTLKTTTGTIDTTTKDTNSKVGAMQTKVDGIDSNVAEIKSTVSNLGGETSTTGWGVLAQEKTFSGQYSGLVTMNDGDLQSFAFIDYFVPPVAGVYTVEIIANQTVGDWFDMDLYMFTREDFTRMWQTAIIMNELGSGGSFTGSFWSLRDIKRDTDDNSIGQYEFMNHFDMYEDTEVLSFGYMGTLNDQLTSRNTVYLDSGKPYILTGYIAENSGGGDQKVFISSVKFYYGNEVNPYL